MKSVRSIQRLLLLLSYSILFALLQPLLGLVLADGTLDFAQGNVDRSYTSIGTSQFCSDGFLEV